MEVLSCPSLTINRSKARKEAEVVLSVLSRVFSLKFNGIPLAQVIFKLWVVYGQNIIDVPICEIKPRCQLFPAG